MVNKNDIKKSIEEAIVKYIAEKVIEKINELNKTALVLFTGSTIGFNQSIKSLRILRSNGWKFRFVMSKGAEIALSKGLLKDMLSVDDVITEDSLVDINSLIKNNNFIIIPSLTINTAAKIANCICDNLVTNIISDSMAEGKTVIASINGCCPDNEERNNKGFNVNEAYKEKLRNNMMALRSYGIKLTTSENLAEKVNNSFSYKYSKPNLKSDKVLADDVHKEIWLKDKIISRGCIIDNNSFSIIKIDKNAVITDLAKEEAARLNIKLIKE